MTDQTPDIIFEPHTPEEIAQFWSDMTPSLTPDPYKADNSQQTEVNLQGPSIAEVLENNQQERDK